MQARSCCSSHRKVWPIATQRNTNKRAAVRGRLGHLLQCIYTLYKTTYRFILHLEHVATQHWNSAAWQSQTQWSPEIPEIYFILYIFW